MDSRSATSESYARDNNCKVALFGLFIKDKEVLAAPAENNASTTTPTGGLNKIK